MWVYVYLTYQKSACMNFTMNICYRCIATNAKLYYIPTLTVSYTMSNATTFRDNENVKLLFDTSDYPANNVYGMPLANKKVPGLMKDENYSAIMIEFVGLRVKMYALKVDGKKDTKKAKDVKSNVVARTITFDDYTMCLQDEIEMMR